jgi:hypothetical protein
VIRESRAGVRSWGLDLALGPGASRCFLVKTQWCLCKTVLVSLPTLYDVAENKM